MLHILDKEANTKRATLTFSKFRLEYLVRIMETLSFIPSSKVSVIDAGSCYTVLSVHQLGKKVDEYFPLGDEALVIYGKLNHLL